MYTVLVVGVLVKRNYEQKLKKGNNLKLLPLVATLKPTNSGEMNKIPAMSLVFSNGVLVKRNAESEISWVGQTIATLPSEISKQLLPPCLPIYQVDRPTQLICISDIYLLSQQSTDK